MVIGLVNYLLKKMILKKSVFLKYKRRNLKDFIIMESLCLQIADLEKMLNFWKVITLHKLNYKGKKVKKYKNKRKV